MIVWASTGSINNDYDIMLVKIVKNILLLFQIRHKYDIYLQNL